MKTILVGTDFDEGSNRALEKACELARKFESTVHVLHVLEPVDEPDSDDPETREFYDKLEATSQKKLDNTMAQVTGVTVAGLTRIGHRHPTILGVANEVDADLIVLGSHAISPTDQRIGTSHRVAVTSSRPVLLVP